MARASCPHSEARAGRRQLLRLAALALAMPAAGPALALLPATGPEVLRLRGRVLAPNAGAHAVFDMAMLSALPQTSFTTRTPWYTRARSFTGPLLRDVLSAARARGPSLVVHTLNDYQVTIPYEDAQRHDLIAARLIDGQPLQVRDKGPLFLIYPFDHDPALRSAVYYGRCAWQLRSIEVT